MILLKSRNNPDRVPIVWLRNEPYLFINLFFAGVILLTMVYSGIFSPDKNNYPIACIHEKLTGIPCVSCGLSHSFSLIVRGRFTEAMNWNIYGIRIFLFFILQLFLRIIFSFFYMKYPDTRKQLILLDIIGSGIIFFLAFWPFIMYIVRF